MLQVWEGDVGDESEGLVWAGELGLVAGFVGELPLASALDHGGRFGCMDLLGQIEVMLVILRAGLKSCEVRSTECVCRKIVREALALPQALL